MKRILITGANSYIGTSFEKYLEKWPDKYQIDTIDMIDNKWREKNFSGYDVVFHVAGLVHKKETKKNANLYYKVNRDLCVETAIKAKNEGVKQFIFLSTMSIYGLINGVITKSTIPNPKSNYAKSKYQAEIELNKLSNDSFNITIIRPPMVYGYGCKGNFQSVVKIVKKVPFFPKIKNYRSMIYIDNLSCCFKLCIDKNISGVVLPQNKEYVNTTHMALLIGKKMSRNIKPSLILGILIKFAICFCTKCKKAFGNLIYQNTEDLNYEYCKIEFEESIKRSIR